MSAPAAPVTTTAAPEVVQAGLSLKKAIDSARQVLTPLGYCASQVVSFLEEHAEHELEEDDDEEWKDNRQWGSTRDYEYGDEDAEDAVDEKEAAAQATALIEAANRRPPALRRTKRLKLVRHLNHLKDQFSRCWQVAEYRAGSQWQAASERILSSDMTLTVTRAGCEYSGPMAQLSVESDLARFHLHGSPSAYGDVQAMATVVDPAVRSARELTASEFTVSDSVLQLVARLWAQHFWPSAVRVEAYKINVYGPGDRFKPHRDTPADGLVGTLLLGLGDDSDGQFTVGNDSWRRSLLDSWAAFYPSVVHSVTEVTKGYRGTMAFKIFALVDQAKLDTLKSDYMKEQLMAIPRPFGLLLDYQYAVDTTQMQGWDAVVCHVLDELAQTAGIKVRRLSVVTTLDTERWPTSDSEEMAPATCDTAVYAFDDEHIQLALAGKKAKGRDLLIAWRQQLPDNMPFYTHQNLAEKGTVWSQVIDEGAVHTGNEARPWDEKSVYLHWAVIVA